MIFFFEVIICLDGLIWKKWGWLFLCNLLILLWNIFFGCYFFVIIFGVGFSRYWKWLNIIWLILDCFVVGFVWKLLFVICIFNFLFFCMETIFTYFCVFLLLVFIVRIIFWFNWLSIWFVFDIGKSIVMKWVIWNVVFFYVFLYLFWILIC